MNVIKKGERSVICEKMTNKEKTISKPERGGRQEFLLF